MKIVDAQVHVWRAESPDRPWPKRNTPHRPVPYEPDDLLADMKGAGVDRVVLVPPSWEGDRNDLSLEAAAAHPGRFAVMGRLDPKSPASRGKLATWREQPGMLGLRFILYKPEFRTFFEEGGMEWLWKEAEENGVPIYVLASHDMMPLLDGVAARYPGLKLVLDHMGLCGPARDAAAFEHFDRVLALSKRPNVAAKMSSLPTYSTDTFPYRNLHPYIRAAFDAFGPQRLFWGTDITRSPITYRQQVALFTEELPWLAGSDLEWVMGRAVCDWLGWPLGIDASAMR